MTPEAALRRLLAIIATGDVASVTLSSLPFLIEGTAIMAKANIRIEVFDPGPTLVADEVVTNPNEPVEFRPLENDSDPLGRALRLVGVTQPADGALKILADGVTVRYTPPANWAGVAEAEYEAEPVNEG